MTTEVKQPKQRSALWRILRWGVHYVAVVVGLVLRLLGAGRSEQCVVRRVTVGVHRWRGTRRARLAFVSDIHASTRPRCPPALLASAARTVLAAAPDVVVLGGDYVDAPADAPLLENTVAPALLAPLVSTRVPVLAALGNHDQATPALRAHTVAALTQAGAQVLDHTATVLPHARLRIVGVGDSSTPGDFDPAPLLTRATHTSPDCLHAPCECSSTPLALPGAEHASATLERPCCCQRDEEDHEEPLITIAVTHNPDGAEELVRERGCDVVLAGHTHGTQVWAPPPRGGPVLPWLKRTAPRWLQPAVRLLHGSDVRRWDWAAGLHRVACPCGANTALLYVTCGLGCHPPGRIFCPPEVTIIDFVPEDDEQMQQQQQQL